MNRLRNRLILIFLLATLTPLGISLWLTLSLLDGSLDLVARRDREIDALSKALEETGREYYQQAREHLRHEVAEGLLVPERLPEKAPRVEDFYRGGEKERFVIGGSRGNLLHFYVRKGGEVWIYTHPLELEMSSLAEKFRNARRIVQAGEALDLRRGFSSAQIVLVAGIWIVSVFILVFVARRVSRPIQELTEGLGRVASGDLEARVKASSDDEVGRAVLAFNHMADQLKQSRERVVYLAQMASWQTLARKMAHEVKNSLTPIRLTVDEMAARMDRSRLDAADAQFLEQASQIVADEVETLERRIRAFSRFAAEPDVRLGPLAVEPVIEERIALLRTSHPGVEYRLASGGTHVAMADADLLKGILTNLLENAAEAMGGQGVIEVRALGEPGSVAIEVHDSGPGLSPQVRQNLFQPTITFKKKGMGLGLSIARKSALLMGGDLAVAGGALGGAAFRVTLPSFRGEMEAEPA